MSFGTMVFSGMILQKERKCGIIERVNCRNGSVRNDCKRKVEGDCKGLCLHCGRNVFSGGGDQRIHGTEQGVRRGSDRHRNCAAASVRDPDIGYKSGYQRGAVFLRIPEAGEICGDSNSLRNCPAVAVFGVDLPVSGIHRRGYPDFLHCRRNSAGTWRWIGRPSGRLHGRMRFCRADPKENISAYSAGNSNYAD